MSSIAARTAFAFCGPRTACITRSEKMQATTAFRLAWTPILSGIFLFYLPIVWIGYDPVWVYGMVSVSLSYQFFVHTELVPHIRWLGMGHRHAVGAPRPSRQQSRISRQELRRRAADLGPPVRVVSGRRPDIDIRYGLVHPRSSEQPFVIAYEDFWQMIRERSVRRSVGEALARMFGRRRGN